MKEKQRIEFGRFVARHRQNAQLNQSQAARAAGLSRSQWTRIETGKTGTKHENIAAIANAINADLSETYHHAGFAPPTAIDGQNGFAQSDFYALFRKHERLPAVRRIRFRPVMEMVARELDHLSYT